MNDTRKKERKNNKVIYSALVGHYDEIRQPEVISEEFDYIIFSNDIPEKQLGIWEIRPIHYFNPIQTKIARYVKTHPEELLPEYDYSVWMDLNVLIKSNLIYTKVTELIQQNILVSSMYHLGCQCIYEEMFRVLDRRYEHENIILNWGHYLRQENYPLDNGMFETNILFRSHKNKQIAEMDKLWWWCIEKYSRRDQLSFNYALWKFNIPYHFLLGVEKNTRNDSSFEIYKHSKSNIILTEKQKPWLMRIAWQNRIREEMVRKLYYQAYSSPFPHLYAATWGISYQCYKNALKIKKHIFRCIY